MPELSTSTPPARSLAEAILQDVRVTFKIGLSGFGELGQAIFREALERPCIEIAAIHCPDTTPEDIIESLQRPEFLPKSWTAELSSYNAEHSIQEISIGEERRTQTIQISNEPRTFSIPWHSVPSLYHVIDTIATSAYQAKTQHLHSHGAKKALLANSDVERNVPRFRANITNNHRRKYQVQNLIFAHEVCSPWALRAISDRIFGSSGDRVFQQATSIVNLMIDVISRDSVGACRDWLFLVSGRGDPNESWDEVFD
ncbi:unnamed protein product [Cercospora beticola]|nr:unnamed protein product [Cercospora beticola]